jgi:hypothetical protein
MVRNALKHEYGDQWGGIGAFIAKKLRCDFVALTSVFIAPIQLVLNRSSCSNETVRNAPKYEFGDQWGRSGALVVKNSDATSLH